MEWNSIQLAQQFLQRANALHPDDDAERYSEVLATQDLYYECYMTAFSRDQFAAMLSKAINGDVKLPEDDERVNSGEYIKAYRMEAKRVSDQYLKNQG